MRLHGEGEFVIVMGIMFYCFAVNIPEILGTFGISSGRVLGILILGVGWTVGGVRNWSYYVSRNFVMVIYKATGHSQ